MSTPLPFTHPEYKPTEMLDRVLLHGEEWEYISTDIPNACRLTTMRHISPGEVFINDVFKPDAEVEMQRRLEERMQLDMMRALWEHLKSGGEWLISVAPLQRVESTGPLPPHVEIRALLRPVKERQRVF